MLPLINSGLVLHQFLEERKGDDGFFEVVEELFDEASDHVWVIYRL